MVGIFISETESIVKIVTFAINDSQIFWVM